MLDKKLIQTPEETQAWTAEQSREMQEHTSNAIQTNRYDQEVKGKYS